MNLNQYKYIYFLGIGGIGMSALARYFLAKKKEVAGYDKTPSNLSKELENEGARIHYADDITKIPAPFLQKEKCLVIYTPAVPKDQSELRYFEINKFALIKRSKALGLISADKNCIAIAGTHGKTTVSSMTAHILHQSKQGSNALLGGITNNYNSNLLLDEKSPNLVVEADEFDRSFLQIYPNIALITSMDADHLDIYLDHAHLHQSFQDFVSQIKENGILILKKGLEKHIHTNSKSYTYSISHPQADFTIEKLRLSEGNYIFQISGPELLTKEITLKMPGMLNVENALAAASAAFLNGASPSEIEIGLSTFKGVKRRMEIVLSSKNLIFIDDYAHHPEELRASISSVKSLYSDKKICGIFQPHLFSRTKDFLDEFAKSLALLDQLILLDIYPARELPIPGITSQLLLDKVELEQKILLQKEEIISYLLKNKPQVLLTLGAGDIDRLIEKIKIALQ
ncbi:MAG: UDP-N-acetylmuramate--L-alanine ligase [Bacteroidales bacterium]|nr:UDP-N-acetylmuramate--L-alanine ligase [Bacteroidales bacterium]